MNREVCAYSRSGLAVCIKAIGLFFLLLFSTIALAQVLRETPDPDPPMLVNVPAAPELLDQNCVVSVLNRNTQVNPDGTWILPSVPAGFGLVRARASCVRNGVTLFGQSDLFSISKDQSVTLPQIILGNTSPIPANIAVTAQTTKLTQISQTVLLTVIGTFQGGTQQDLSAASSGTQYQVSNPAIISVTPDGLVTALSSGTAVVQALNEGAQGLIQIQVSLGIDSDGDGIPDDAEIRMGLNPHDPTDALLDPDHDGLTNLQEFQLGTDPHNPDTDGDGLLDGQEVLNYHTNPLVKDSDGDGIPDGVEVQTGSDPKDSHSFFLNKALASLEVKPNNFTLTVNSIQGQASQQLQVIGHLIDGKTTIDLTQTSTGTNYQSSDLNICNFGSPDGNVFAGGNGTCTITVSNSGFTAQASGVIRAFTPTPLSFVAIPGFANGVAVNGSYAYVAAGSAGLRIVNVTDRSNPFLVGSLALAGNADGVKAIGNTVIVAGGSAGIHAVDVSNPALPALKSTLSTAGTAQDVAISGNTAYVANGSGLFLADITNPAAIAQISSLPLTGNIRGVAVDPKRKLVAVAAGTSGIYVVDISNPLSPFKRSQLVTFSDAHQVAIKGNTVFVANFHNIGVAYQSSLVAVDITDPANPVVANKITNESLGGNLNDVTIQGNFALSADVFFVNGIPITDISTPTSLQSRATLNFPARDDNGLGIAADGSYVYLTTDHGAIDKFGTTGDARLYIGQYLAQEDTKGIPPTASITSPTANSTVVAGATVVAIVDANDDIGVSFVNLQMNGQTVATSTTSPFQLSFTVPTGASTITIGATATDLGGNVGTASNVTLNVIPDPGTTVIGRVLNVGSPVNGATVTVNGGGTGLTGSDGRFTVNNVPTVLGNIRAIVTATINGAPVTLASAAVPPILGGTTNVGDINLTPVLINFDNIAGITPMGNSPGSTVPTAAQLGTQLQSSLGVTFTSGSAYVGVVNLGVGHATSGTNGIGGSTTNGLLSYSNPIVVTFSLPGTPSIPAVTDFVSIRGDLLPGSGTDTMDAFDLNGNLITSVTKQDTAGGTLSVSAQGIHSVRISETQANIAFDDLGFDPLSSAYANDHTPPSVSITSPAAGQSLIQGSQVPIQVSATDDLALKSVSISVNGQVVFTGTKPPFQVTYTVPAGVTTVTIDASGLDFNNNVGNAQELVLNAIPDPGTTVIGRVLGPTQIPIAGAYVSLLGRSSQTAADGTFSFAGAPTIKGNLTVTAVATGNGVFGGKSASKPPVVGGTTNVGDIVTAARNLIAVVNNGDASVSVIDVSLSPPAVVTTLFAGAAPWGVTLTPDGSKGVASAFSGGTATLFSLMTTPPSFLSLFQIGTTESSAITHDGRFAITTDGTLAGITVASIDIENQKIVNSLTMPASGAVVTMDNSRVIVRDSQGNQFRVLLLSPDGVLSDTGIKIPNPYSQGFQVGSMALSPNGRFVLVANDGANVVSILRIDQNNNVTTDGTISVCCTPHGVAFTSDGTKAFVANAASGDLAVMNIDSNDVVSDSGIRVPIPDGGPGTPAAVGGIAISPDGRGYVVGNAKGKLSIFDTRSNAVIGSITVGTSPGGVAVPGTGIGVVPAPSGPNGIAPTVSITSPSSGTTVVEDSIVPVTLSASDDQAVASVNLFLNGNNIGRGVTPPYQFSFIAPIGLPSLTLTANAFDYKANMGTAASVLLPVIADAKTTVVGRVLSGATPIAGALVSADGKFSTTLADGTFSIAGVPTVLGNVSVTASGVVNGSRWAGVSASVTPVFNGTTNVGDIVTAARTIIAATSQNAVNVTFIDTSTSPPTVIGSSSTGANQPTAAFVTPDGKTAIVSNFSAGVLFRFFDLTQNPPVVLGDITSGTSAFASMILSKDGRFAFGVYPTITSIDVANRKVINSLNVNSGAAAVTPDGTTVITGDPRTSSIAVLSVSSRGVLTDNGVRLSHNLYGGNTYTGGIDISPNGHIAIVTNPWDNSLSVLKIDTAHNVTDTNVRIPICCRPWGVAFTKDGSKAYIVNSSSGDLAVVSIDVNDIVTDTGTRISLSGSLVQQGPEPATISISQDGRGYVVNSFANVGGNIVFLNTVTIFDTKTDTVLGTVQVGPAPTSVGAQ